MDENVTWMDEILKDKTEEFIEGYIFAQNGLCNFVFIEGVNQEWSDDHGTVYIYESELQ